MSLSITPWCHRLMLSAKRLFRRITNCLARDDIVAKRRSHTPFEHPQNLPQKLPNASSASRNTTNTTGSDFPVPPHAKPETGPFAPIARGRRLSRKGTAIPTAHHDLSETSHTKHETPQPHKTHLNIPNTLASEPDSARGCGPS